MIATRVQVEGYPVIDPSNLLEHISAIIKFNARSQLGRSGFVEPILDFIPLIVELVVILACTSYQIIDMIPEDKTNRTVICLILL